MAAALPSVSASAQPTAQRTVTDGLHQAVPVRVQLSMQLFLRGPTDDSQEAARGRTRARRTIYELASRECELLRAAIAKDCRLTIVTINFYRQNQPTLQGYTVTGSMTFQITLK